VIERQAEVSWVMIAWMVIFSFFATNGLNDEVPVLFGRVNFGRRFYLHPLL
jgi:hypothetical protein